MKAVTAQSDFGVLIRVKVFSPSIIATCHFIFVLVSLVKGNLHIEMSVKTKLVALTVGALNNLMLWADVLVCTHFNPLN